MNRRSFLGTSAALGTTTALATSAEAAESKDAADLYELRTYTLKDGKRPLLDAYLSKAYIPAVKRHGGGSVGIFSDPATPLKVYVLTVFPSPETALTLEGKLAADSDYLKAAADYLAATAADPVYTRIESSLLTAITGMPHLAKPDASKPRLLNLRIYESHNERAARKKVEMFEKSELAIFRRTGLTPVFFASTLVGSLMPNLTYMLVFPDEAGRKAAWDKFRDDAEWKKLKSIPEYADKEIVSHITNLVLTPAEYSEI
jgi:NIPSNAP